MRGVLVVLLLLAACEDSREWQVRQAVRAVVQGKQDQRRAMDFVVAQGRYAIPEIEQQIHAAPDAAKKRLIAVLVRIDDRDAVPLLRILAERGSAPVREAARAALGKLGH
jgi:HEAT repeat protein